MSEENTTKTEGSDAAENSWLILKTAVNSVMNEIAGRVDPENLDVVVKLRDKTGRYMAAEYMRHHHDPRQLLAEMIEAGAIKVDYNDVE